MSFVNGDLTQLFICLTVLNVSLDSYDTGFLSHYQSGKDCILEKIMLKGARYLYKLITQVDKCPSNPANVK